jgi:site-specific DNA recombinase
MTQQAIGYIRVSTAGQANEGASLDAQRQRIEAWSLANGVELAGVFTDEGISGKRADNRPELLKALEAVKQTGAVLVVYSLSRLARSTKDTILIGEQLEKAGADLASLSEKIDTTTAAGKMVFRMLAVMAEFERDLVSERTTTVMAHKRANGQRVGSIPYGFDLDDDGTTLVENDSEQGVLALIESLREDGYSLRAIADELSARGIPTKQGRRSWTHSTVQRIIHRTAA